MSHPVPSAPVPGWVLAAPIHDFVARDAIEEHFDRLARVSPGARRTLQGPGNGRDDAMRVAAVHQPGSQAGAQWIAEAQLSLALDVRTLDAQRAPPNYSVMLVQAGEVELFTPDGSFRAGPGEGLLIDPADAERMRLAPGAHFVEFELPKSQMLALGAELMPGAIGGAPRFNPAVRADLARQLGQLGGQAAARLIQSAGGAPGPAALFRRWCELIALTVLQEQPLLGSPRPRALTPLPAPASLRRALEFIDAHAEREIMLADIARAACVSASSLLRQFNEFLGQTPGAFVRQVRLDRARGELQRGHHGSVRALAQRWGFENPSKFSQAYFRRFGEMPSETRAGLR